MDIKIDLDGLQNVITLNETQISNIDAMMTAACNAVATLTVLGWEGKTKDQFLTKFTDFKQTMKAVYENLKNFNSELKSIKSDGDTLYQEGSSLISSL